MSPRPHAPRARELQGRRAGLVSRLLAVAIDFIVVVFIGIALLLVVAGIRALFTGEFEVQVSADEIRGPVFTLLLLAYLGYGWGLNGRTAGLVALGLRVVHDDGADLSFARGVVRAALYLVFLPGILWAAVSRKNASVQDLILGTAVIHDWGPAAATHHVPRPTAGG